MVRECQVTRLSDGDTSPGEYSLLHALEWKEKEAASFQGDAEQVSKLGSLTKPPEETRFPLHWQWALGDLSPPRSCLTRSALLLFLLQLEIPR